MKRARNLVTGLLVLVLVYGGCYRLFLREKMLPIYSNFSYAHFGFSSTASGWRRFYGPAAEIDCRWNIDRPAKKLLQGHWHSEETGDFLTIAEDGKCSFQLGEFKSSAYLTFGRSVRGYAGRFQQGGNPYIFIVSRAAPGKATAYIHSPDMERLAEFRDLTPAP